jgi:hypothetical protein
MLPFEVSIAILNHIAESRLVPLNTCGHHSSEQCSRKLPIPRSSIEAVGFVALDDLAAAPGHPRERALFLIASPHACGRARSAG